jgi:hypothetical protein
MAKYLPTIKSKLSPNGTALKWFKTLVFLVFAIYVYTLFTATHIWPPPYYITFVVKTLNFNGLHAFKSLSTPSNKNPVLLVGFNELTYGS